MKMISTKKPILIGIICIGLAAIAAGTFLFLKRPPKAPSPHDLLEIAATRVEKNLCFLAILDEDPQNQAVWAALLEDLSIHADPLTYSSACKKATDALGALPDFSAHPSAPFVSPPKKEKGNLTANGKTIANYSGANGVCQVTNTVYFYTDDGIYADFLGLQRKIAPTIAQGMIAGEEGLYFLNLLNGCVQYLSGDGSFIKTLSSIKAKDFTFHQGSLWILTPEGDLYKDQELIQAPPLSEICAVGGNLYGCAKEGIYLLSDENSRLCFQFFSKNLTAGEDGNLYFLNEDSYPYRMQNGQGVLIKNVSSVAITQEGESLLVLTKKGKLRDLNK